MALQQPAQHGRHSLVAAVAAAFVVLVVVAGSSCSGGLKVRANKINPPIARTIGRRNTGDYGSHSSLAASPPTTKKVFSERADSYAAPTLLHYLPNPGPTRRRALRRRSRHLRSGVRRRRCCARRRRRLSSVCRRPGTRPPPSKACTVRRLTKANSSSSICNTSTTTTPSTDAGLFATIARHLHLPVFTYRIWPWRRSSFSILLASGTGSGLVLPRPRPRSAGVWRCWLGLAPALPSAGNRAGPAGLALAAVAGFISVLLVPRPLCPAPSWVPLDPAPHQCCSEMLCAWALPGLLKLTSVPYPCNQGSVCGLFLVGLPLTLVACILLILDSHSHVPNMQVSKLAVEFLASWFHTLRRQADSSSSSLCARSRKVYRWAKLAHHAAVLLCLPSRPTLLQARLYQCLLSSSSVTTFGFLRDLLLHSGATVLHHPSRRRCSVIVVSRTPPQPQLIEARPFRPGVYTDASLRRRALRHLISLLSVDLVFCLYHSPFFKVKM